MEASMTNHFLYGKGIFTTIAIRDGEPFLWEKHWRRLTDNAAKVGIDLAEHAEVKTRDALEKSIATNNLTCGRARITFYDESLSEIWLGGDEHKTTLSIIVAEHRIIPQPFKLTVSPYIVNSRSPLAGVKSCNYLENILALDEATTRDFHEAVRVNELGQITSGCMANVFWLKDEKLYTPILATGCLAGTTREFVLENCDCEEVEVAINELDSVDAIFLTSAGIGVINVAQFDKKHLSDVGHPITTLLPTQI